MLVYLAGVILALILFYVHNKLIRAEIPIGTALMISTFSWISVGLYGVMLILILIITLAEWLGSNTPIVNIYNKINNKFMNK